MVSDSLTCKNQLLNINVKNYKEKLTNIAAHEKQCFQGGRLKQFMSEWMSLTSDKEILNAINGYEIELTDIPWQMKKPKPITFTVKEENVISKEIAELLKKLKTNPMILFQKSLSERRNMGLHIE